jgi:endonuclease-3
MVVDTHVTRVSQRLGWTRNTEPEKIERDLNALFSRDLWDHASHVIVFHGRRCCEARRPRCGDCSVNDLCPSAFDAAKVGRKPSRSRSPNVPSSKPAKRKPA